MHNLDFNGSKALIENTFPLLIKQIGGIVFADFNQSIYKDV